MRCPFCRHVGVKVEPVSAWASCPRCGAEFPVSDQKCPVCGRTLMAEYKCPLCDSLEEDPK